MWNVWYAQWQLGQTVLRGTFHSLPAPQGTAIASPTLGIKILTFAKLIDNLFNWSSSLAYELKLFIHGYQTFLIIFYDSYILCPFFC